jgi:hypothetical protein
VVGGEVAGGDGDGTDVGVTCAKGRVVLVDVDGGIGSVVLGPGDGTGAVDVGDVGRVVIPCEPEEGVAIARIPEEVEPHAVSPRTMKANPTAMPDRECSLMTILTYIGWLEAWIEGQGSFPRSLPAQGDRRQGGRNPANMAFGHSDGILVFVPGGGRIARLQLSNFKAFESFTVTFSESALIVGPNNAGKSTLLSALRAPVAAPAAPSPSVPVPGLGCRSPSLPVCRWGSNAELIRWTTPACHHHLDGHRE